MDFQARIDAARGNIADKCNNAELMSKQKEQSIADLEKIEADMLNRIKNT